MKTIISILFIALSCFVTFTASARSRHHRAKNNIYDNARNNSHDIRYKHESYYTTHRGDQYSANRGPKQYRGYQYDRQ